ncbi:ABC transporter permease [Peptoniphilus mikwangii]|uniref:ABC transporter permease n=1 Tax=Peptoniphilus mikwangii TaxID=1354300 RepID=UPI00041F4709|nr:ABC transporter [Peptoniphilus mikwangii]
MLLGLNSVLLASIEVGLIFAILSMGVVFTFKILDIADLSVEGTFPLGAFIFAKMITSGLGVYISMIFSFIFGLVAGLVTFLLYKKLKIASILAGILTMTILYSVNLRIMGKSNVALFDFDNLFVKFEKIPKGLILFAIVLIIKIIIDSFLKTERGYMLVITGDNESLVKSLGKNPDLYTMIGLMISNGLVSLSGALMSQYQGFADSQMGATIIVTALASIIIGDTFLKNSRKIKITTRAISGAIIYRIISGLAIHAGLDSSDLKMVTAFIVILFITYNNVSAGRIKRIKKSVNNER